jgi:hypothetical protein
MPQNLTGTPRQVAWADKIREEALQARWPEDTVKLLLSINDSTWWIANRYSLKDGTFKAPAPEQLGALNGAAQQSFPATDEPSTMLEYLEQQRREEPTPTGRPQHDVLAWIHAVTQDPRLARAAICAAFLRVYSNPKMQAELRGMAEKQLEAVDRDIAAIKKMLQVKLGPDETA